MLVVGVLQVQLRVRSAHSLKEKRTVVRGIKERMRARYNVSVAEIDDQDVWQSICLGFALAGSDGRWVAAQLTEIVEHLRVHPEAEFIDHEIEVL